MSRGQSIHEASKRTLDFGAENLNGHVSCWRFQDRVGQTSCSSDAWLTSGFAIRDHEPASMSCSAFQSVPQPRIPFKAKMHVNAIQQPFRPSSGASPVPTKNAASPTPCVLSNLESLFPTSRTPSLDLQHACAAAPQVAVAHVDPICCVPRSDVELPVMAAHALALTPLLTNS